MPLGRRHEPREERREDRRGEGQLHYKMRQRLVSIGDDFWIDTDGGERAHKVDGQALRLRKTPVTVLAATAAMAHESG